MSDQNMIIAIGVTAVVTIVTTAAPFLIFDLLKSKRQAREAAGASSISIASRCPSTYAGPL